MNAELLFDGYRVSVLHNEKNSGVVMVAQRCECTSCHQTVLKNAYDGKFYVICILPQFFLESYSMKSNPVPKQLKLNFSNLIF